MAEQERHLATAHFEHGAAAAAAGVGMAEAGVEEAGIVHAELTYQRIERHHLGSIVGRHVHAFARHQDIELVGIENELVGAAVDQRLPIVEHVERILDVHVDHRRVPLGAEADEAAAALALEVDRQRDALAHLLVGIEHERLDLMQGAVLVDAEPALADTEAHLAKARAAAHAHREGARRNLEIERPGIAGG